MHANVGCLSGYRFFGGRNHWFDAHQRGFHEELCALQVKGLHETGPNIVPFYSVQVGPTYALLHYMYIFLHVYTIDYTVQIYK